MQLTNHQPFGPIDVLDRLRYRRAARRYAAHGWPVTPGAIFLGDRFDCGRPGCPIMRCHPADESWEDGATTDEALVANWWRNRPHVVLLATGWRFDALEVPAALGVRLLGTARLHAGLDLADARGPVAEVPSGSWFFLVRPGTPLRSELEGCLDIVRHGRGSWIPAAPTRTAEGPVRWLVEPDRVGWRLPAAAAVQSMLVAALGDRLRSPRRVAAVPRQLSTTRRAA